MARRGKITIMIKKASNNKSGTAKTLRVWLVGGGTGGHITPLLAVAEVLRRHSDVKITYIGEAKSREEELARHEHIPFQAIMSGKLRRSWDVVSIYQNVRDLTRVWRGYWQARRLILKQRPDVIFSKGGQVAPPVCLAAKHFNIPVIIHESDAAMGLANKFTARLATKVLTGFPAVNYPNIDAQKIIPVGIPLSAEFNVERKTKKPDRPMILITGGIQGAQSINRAVALILPLLLAKYDVMHVTGDASYDEFVKIKAELSRDLRDNYGVIPFTHNMAELMREATIVLSRASGTTMFELATLGKPMILIPLPSAGSDHQRANARIFVGSGAAIMLEQSTITPEILFATIDGLLSNAIELARLKQNVAQFACPAAAKVVADLLLKEAN